MNRLEKLQAALRAIEAKAKPLAEKESLTEAEGAELNGYLDQIEANKREQDQVKRAHAAFSSDPADRIEVVGDEADRGFASAGEYFQAVARAAMPAGGRIAGKPTGQVDRRLLGVRAAAAGASEAVPSDGGFLVGKDTSTTLIQKAHETALLPKLCDNVPIGPNSDGLQATTIDETDRATGSRLGGVRVYRKNEAGAGIGAKIKFGKLSIDLEDMIGLAYVTNNLLNDATALEAIITKGFADEFGFKLDDEIIEGTGAGQCLGILNSKALVSVAKEAGQGAATINFQNVVKMYARIFGRSRLRAVWLANAEVLPQLLGLNAGAGTGGLPVFIPPGGLSVAPYGTLFGRPLMFIEQASALGAVGDLILADFGEYLLIDKNGIQEAASMHVNFTTNEMAFRFVYRVNGQPTWDKPLIPFKGTGSTVSPFVALAVRA